MVKWKSIVVMLGVLAIFAATAVVATATEPPTPFYIYGWVFDAGQPLNNPNVMIAKYHHVAERAETNATSNYYQLIMPYVSTGSFLAFKVRDDITGNCTPMYGYEKVTQDYMDRGGMFEQNFTVGISLYPWWDGGPWCGDVDCDCIVWMGDYCKLYDNVTYNKPFVWHGKPANSSWALWAADMDCNGEVNVDDCKKLIDYVGHSKPPNCCTRP